MESKEKRPREGAKAFNENVNPNAKATVKSASSPPAKFLLVLELLVEVQFEIHSAGIRFRAVGKMGRETGTKAAYSYSS